MQKYPTDVEYVWTVMLIHTYLHADMLHVKHVRKDPFLIALSAIPKL